MRRRQHSLFLRSLTLALALGIAATRIAQAAPPPRMLADAPDQSPAARLAEADLLRAPDALKPGEFAWQAGWDGETSSPVIVMVNLELQRAYVFRDGQRIGTATISSGKPGHATPTGVFAILQKQKMHHSNKYEDPRTGRAAAMPWMQRLSWEGVALHAGHVRAQPASHGCVRLPPEFAQQLYGITQKGDTVVIAQDGSIEALSQAGVDAALALLLDSANSMHEIARKFVAEDPSASSGAPARAAFSP